MDLNEDHSYYKYFVNYMRKVGRPYNKLNVQKAYLEVMNHVQAYLYLLTRVVVKDRPLSKHIIKTTQGILTTGINLHHGTHWKNYVGVYRDYPIPASSEGKKKISFLHHKAVPRYMADFVSNFNDDLRNAKEADDPIYFELAVKYCARFTNIHPFADGNGRVSRMILNLIMLKGAGFLVPMGEQGDQEPKTYLDVASRSVKAFYEQDMKDVYEISHLELAILVAEKAQVLIQWFMEKPDDFFGW